MLNAAANKENNNIFLAHHKYYNMPSSSLQARTVQPFTRAHLTKVPKPKITIKGPITPL
uniref:Uncharacterized protein n=1 Tax=Bartonella schoenbuchensis (strain DSM 13525 / NCTC 13165 / R1) TaxID=687861 RepID=E6Z0I8_BARSR|nr:hypothetical protein B11C_40481 [Bartonella schoenbuchensis R1]